MPAITHMMAKEAPSVAVVFVLHEDADAGVLVAGVGMRVDVFFPDDAEEEGAGAVHDGYVGELPVLVVFH